MTYDILVVDDEPLVRASLRRLLRHDDWRVTDVASAAEAEAAMGGGAYDLAIIDYALGGSTGMDVLEALRARSPSTIAVMLTAYGSIGLAVEALKKGAYDFLQKDSSPQVTRHVVENALEKARLRKEIELLRSERVRRSNLPQIICRAPVMQRALEMVDEYARTDATVLLEGETGVGKSLVAEYLHVASSRGDGPFVTINCGAIPKELIESELFGYAEGAFTGAKQRGKIGLIERANGGTLFLDEIGDLTLELQSKLLHVLETREYLSVGAVEPTRVDVRFVSATNTNLAEAIADGRFRRDLYYRLNVASISVPPLRERREDVLPLARHFTHRLNEQYGRGVCAISPEAERLLEAHAWPGNVRELRNAIERVVLLKKTDTIDARDLAFLGNSPAADADGVAQFRVGFDTGEDVLQELTRRVVMLAWEQSGQNQSRAARLLGIPRTTFQTYVHKYGL
jgi:two-component system, NtrC family, response regulator AtoC